MPSKLAIHVSNWTGKVLEFTEKMQPSCIKMFKQDSEMNMDAIKRVSPGTIIVFRQHTPLSYRDSPDAFVGELSNALSKLRGRGILWEGINEPVVQSIEEAKQLNAWYVRFADLIHSYGEMVAGFSWSTGNPTPANWEKVLPYVVNAAAACDVHAFHEYYSTWGGQGDWCRYRAFEASLPAHARKPVIITEAGLDDNGDPYSGGYRGKVSVQEYMEILKAYDQQLLQDPYVLGATIYQWGDPSWPSFEIDMMINQIADYCASVGGGASIPWPWPIPDFEPLTSYTFTASPQSIIVGQSATLTWDAEGVREVYLDGVGVGGRGSQVVTPTETTTYTLRVVMRDGSTQDLAATVTVNPPPQLECAFSATPESILVGQSSLLRWDVEGVREVYLDGQGVTGHETRVVAPTATTTYTLHIVLLDGSTKDLTATVTVLPQPTFSFSVAPTAITAGQSATLTWDVQGARSVSLQGQLVNAQSSSIVSPQQTTTYTLHVVLWDGSVNDLTATVTVTPVEEPPTYSFAASPESIAVGASATLQWNVTKSTLVTLNGQTVAAHSTQTVTPTQTTIYTLHIVFVDGTTRDLTATVAVTSQPGGPTRPPTVVLTPQNIAHLKTYPRPAQDNGRGLHFNIDLRDQSIANTVAHLVSINARWTMIYAGDELQAKRAAQACWNVGIMPVVRIGKRVDEPFDPVPYVNALKSIGAPPYIQIYNEPGDIREWKNGLPSNWVEVFASKWSAMANLVYQAGGYPGLQVLGKQELEAVIDTMNANGVSEIWNRTFFAVHNYGANHPPAYPYDPRNQQDHPGDTIVNDEVAVLAFLAFAKWMQDRMGFVVPILGGEGGWEFGASEDNRYPKVEQPYHAQYHAEMFDWFRTGILSNGEPLPDYLFSLAPWIEGGWGADDWWGGPLGDKTETIQAVQAIPAFTRKFSWDATTPPPTPTYAFTATPTAIQSGANVNLQWSVTGAQSVKLDHVAVASQGSKIVTPTQTTTYTLSMIFFDGTQKNLTATVTVTTPPPSAIDWDARLDPLKVAIIKSSATQAWRVVAGKYQDENESGDKQNVYFKVLNADGVPVSGIKCVIDWVGRDPADDPAVVTTDARGEAYCPLWATYNPATQRGLYFIYIKGAASDQVEGLGLPNGKRVSFAFTFKWTTGTVTPPPPTSSYTFTATPNIISAGQSATLEWDVKNASLVTLGNNSVPFKATQVVAPSQTTTYTLHIVYQEGKTQDAQVTVTVATTPPPPSLEWDPRLTTLGVKLEKSTAAHAWRLVSAKYQDETESSGNHHIYYTMLNADGTFAPNVKLVVDWVGRDPGDDPAIVTTNSNGEANCPLWAVMHPELQDGPYFTFAKDAPSDKVTGMGLPVARHVNFVLTYKYS